MRPVTGVVGCAEMRLAQCLDAPPARPRPAPTAAADAVCAARRADRRPGRRGRTGSSPHSSSLRATAWSAPTMPCRAVGPGGLGCVVLFGTPAADLSASMKRLRAAGTVDPMVARTRRGLVQTSVGVGPAAVGGGVQLHRQYRASAHPRGVVRPKMARLGVKVDLASVMDSRPVAAAWSRQTAPSRRPLRLWVRMPERGRRGRNGGQYPRPCRHAAAVDAGAA